MVVPTRPAELAYGYHVYDYPDSEPWVAKKTYPEDRIAAWRAASFPAGPLGRASEVAPYDEKAYAGFPSRKKYRVCRTLGQCNSTVTGYERYSLVKDLQELRTEAETQGLNPALGYAQTYFGRKILVLVFGSNNAAHPQVLLTGGIHGREWISVEIPYLIAEYLIKNYDQDDEIAALVEGAQIWVIPMLNPDGHSWSAVQDRLWRRNRRRYLRSDLTVADPVVYSEAAGRLHIAFPGGGAKDVASPSFAGVDCNRNFRWGQDRKCDPTRETFAGPRAGSEVETQVLVSCAGGNLTFDPPLIGPAPTLTRLHGSIDYHSAKGAILFHDEVDHRLVEGDDAARAAMNRVLRVAHCMQGHIADYGEESNYRCGTTTTIVAESSVGSVMDHCFGVMDAAHRLPLAFTIELDPVAPAATDRNRWSLSKQRIQKVFEKNLPAALCLIDHLRVGPPPPILAPVGPVGAAVAPAACTFRDWPAQIRNAGNLVPG